MRAFRPPPLKDDTEQIIAKSRIDLAYRHEVQNQLTAEINFARRHLRQTKRLLQDVDAALHRFRSAR